MTPAEVHEVLLEEARWWANQPAHAATARDWITFFEELPEDDQMLVMLSGMYPDANAFRNRIDYVGIYAFSGVEHDLPDHREAQQDACTAGQGFRYSRTLITD